MSTDANQGDNGGEGLPMNSESQIREKAEEFINRASSIPGITTERTNGQGLRYDLLPTTDMDDDTIGWESQHDPEIPFNFPSWQKWTWVGLLSAITFLTPFASSILSPAIGTLNKEFGNDSAIVGSMTVSIYLLGYVVGPIFIAPLSEIYGSKLVLTVSNIIFCVWQIGCALAPNIKTLIVCRFFCGVGGAACLTLGGSIIGELFRPHQRGLAIGVWNIGPLIGLNSQGPTIGPILGGFLTKTIGWRWEFWIVLIAAVPVTILIALLTKETGHKALIRRKVVRLRKELGKNTLKSCYDGPRNDSTAQVLLVSLTRPLKMLVLSPLVFFLSLYIAFVFGAVYLLYTTIPSVFKETYGFNPDQAGLVYISLGVGNVLGWLVTTFLSDKLVVKLAQANSGVFEPEMRLKISIYFGMFLPITFFWYGWSSFFQLHWASTIMSLIPYGFGIMGLFLPITTYLVDSHPLYAASAVAANVILRSVVGAFLPLAGPPMYVSLGLGWGNTLLGFICVAMIPLPLIFYKFGASLRASRSLML
ncbi:hypothetical protein QQS21_004868 [Conoideocrella luteorostrata]|uniref:Major facilitator superfamily (MFS) profile domain-containing protein n=1 Tax=Conoideocrella luteorostrata TaxID=1105319 RepID=A0AAJ0CSY7_9HYPO|nr:hypothetical protein QQS21_004868 [Conoideocrella luteorostrata]